MLSLRVGLPGVLCAPARDNIGEGDSLDVAADSVKVHIMLACAALKTTTLVLVANHLRPLDGAGQIPKHLQQVLIRWIGVLAGERVAVGCGIGTAGSVGYLGQVASWRGLWQRARKEREAQKTARRGLMLEMDCCHRIADGHGLGAQDWSSTFRRRLSYLCTPPHRTLLRVEAFAKSTVCRSQVGSVESHVHGVAVVPLLYVDWLKEEPSPRRAPSEASRREACSTVKWKGRARPRFRPWACSTLHVGD